MSEDEADAIFDPTMKKKRKKKKTTFEVEAPVATEGDEAPPAEENENEENMEKSKEENSVDVDDDIFNLTKKKKKKKKVFDLTEMEETLPKEENTEAQAEDQDDEDKAGEGDDDIDFSLPSKKKKKRRKMPLGAEDAADGKEEESTTTKEGPAWQDSDRDYTYDELLGRVFDIMHEKNPDMVAGEKKRFVMKPPHVVRVGTKKSSFCNFSDICKLLHRSPKHLLAFLLSELGTSGSIDGNNQLIIKGRFQQKQIESVLRRYIKEYVTCHTCRSPETILQKDTRLYFLQCETCGSRCSVASIKSGFQAVTGKRAAIRAKTT